MSYFEWTKELDVHVESMNIEHKELINLMNIVYAENEKKTEKKILKTALDNLINYTKKHFDDEEAYMESILYPKLASHKRIHQDLLNKLNEFYNEFNKNNTPLSKKFFHFLKQWLVAHIKGIDSKYGAYTK